jgi:S1 RNA binding domain protein
MEFEIGSVLEGKVTGITKFGAFVALPGGKSGLVHISEIAHSYVSDVRDFLTEGQDVKVKVISVDENNRINLSIKKAMDPPPRPPRPAGPPRGRDNNGGNGRFNGPRGDGEPSGEAGGRPRYNSNNRGGRERTTYTPRNSQPKEPASFEDRLKQFMQESDSRQSDLNRYIDKRGSRRGNGRNRG